MSPLEMELLGHPTAREIAAALRRASFDQLIQPMPDAFNPWLKALANDLMKLVEPETARTRFRGHVEAWCADPHRDIQFIPPRREHPISMREKFVGLAAIHDTVCAGSDLLGPDVWKQSADPSCAVGSIFDKPLMAWAALVHAHVPRLNQAHDVGIRGWLQAVKADLARPKPKSVKGARKAGVEKRLDAELRNRIHSEQSRIGQDERLSPSKPSQKELARRVGESPQYVSKRFSESARLRELLNAFDSRPRLFAVQFQ